VASWQLTRAAHAGTNCARIELWSPVNATICGRKTATTANNTNNRKNRRADFPVRFGAGARDMITKPTGTWA
jgi:hypothetical protein